MDSIISRFNLSVLLQKKLKNYDLRTIADENPELRAEEYFTKLEKEIAGSVSAGGHAAGYSYSARGWGSNSFHQALAKLQKSGENLRVIRLGRLVTLFDMAEKNRKPRVLAVDDVAVVLSAVTTMLENDYDVYSLTRASQVERFLQTTIPDLFILDIEMPDMNGYELVSVIRSFEEHKDTPIMFLTGNSTVIHFQTAMNLGASDFVTKPVESAVLLKKVGNLIKR